MKYRIPTYTCATFVGVAGTFAANFAYADDKASMPDPAEMMKRFEEAGTPGNEHRGLEPLVGYDNLKKKSVNSWVDDMSTAIFTAEGTSDDGGKTIVFESTADCPMTGEKDAPVKQVLRILGPDKHIFEMHDPRRGENSRKMEITYTRK